MAGVFAKGKNLVASSFETEYNTYLDTLNYGDTIDANLSWVSEGLFFYEENINKNIGCWMNQDNKYLAICLINKDTTFGWIRMYVERFGYLGLYDYALLK